ncbi:UNVERIFIED_CONTAM: hypothetical protein NCL1_12131 [Trichonephila clavipes]
MVVINLELILTRREQYSSGRFIQEVQLLNPLSISLETSSLYPFTLSGVVPCSSSNKMNS